jgi:hypothetical protein
MQLNLTNDRPLRSQHSHFNFLPAQRLRVLVLAILNLTAPTPGVRRYSGQAIHFSCTQDQILTVTYRDRTILKTTTDGNILELDTQQVCLLLSIVQTLYNQAEAFVYLIETGEDPPEDWHLEEQLQRIQADDVGAIAQTLFAANKTQLAGYQILQNHLGLVLTRGETDLVLIVRDNYVWNYSTTDQDWEFFQSFRDLRLVLEGY